MNELLQSIKEGLVGERPEEEYIMDSIEEQYNPSEYAKRIAMAKLEQEAQSKVPMLDLEEGFNTKAGIVSSTNDLLSNVANRNYLQDMAKAAAESKYLGNTISSGAGMTAASASMAPAVAGVGAALYSPSLNDNEAEELAKYKLENPENGQLPAVESAKLEAMENIRTAAERELEQKLNNVKAETINPEDDGWEAKRNAYKQLVGRL